MGKVSYTATRKMTFYKCDHCGKVHRSELYVKFCPVCRRWRCGDVFREIHTNFYVCCSCNSFRAPHCFIEYLSFDNKNKEKSYSVLSGLKEGRLLKGICDDMMIILKSLEEFKKMKHAFEYINNI